MESWPPAGCRSLGLMQDSIPHRLKSRFYTVMDFEFDPSKSRTNAEKHGMDFETAQFSWRDLNHVVVEARSTTEPRFANIAELGRKICTTIYTLRGEETPHHTRKESTPWRRRRISSQLKNLTGSSTTETTFRRFLNERARRAPAWSNAVSTWTSPCGGSTRWTRKPNAGV